MSKLCLNNVSYTYEETAKRVLNEVNACFEAGRLYCIIGKLGSGKSTLLSLISGLDTCTDGTIIYQGKEMKQIDCDEYRAKDIGVIFQGYNLLTNATALENVLLSMNISDCQICLLYTSFISSYTAVFCQRAAESIKKKEMKMR